MLTFIFEKDELLTITDDSTVIRDAMEQGVYDLVDRNMLKEFADAEMLAERASSLDGTKYIATDAGPHCHPRYDVQAAPVLGDEISYAFNGDAYPCGTIKKISASLRRVESTDGHVFYRRKLSGSWINNGTWSMIPGHIDERNPSF